MKNNITQSYSTKTGYIAGIWGRFGKREKVFLQPELLLARKGGTIDLQNGGSVKFSNINPAVPVLVGVPLLKIFRFNAGPVANFNLLEDRKLKDALKTTSGDVIKNVSFGYQFGIGIALLGVNLDLRKVGSFSEISVFNISNNQFQEKGWQFTIGFKIKGNKKVVLKF